MKSLVCTVVIAVAGVAAFADLNPIPGGTPQVLAQGRTYGAPVTFTGVGTTGLNILFGATVNGPAVSALRTSVLVDDGVADSPFHGDYISRSINTIQFSLTTSGYVPAMGRLNLKASSRTWRYDFRSQVSAVAGEKKAIVVPFTVGDWTTTAVVTNKDAAFAADLQSVVAVSLTFEPGGTVDGTPEQSYTIEAVMLVNDDGLPSQPGLLTPLEKALIARFGAGYGSIDKLTDAMKRWDADGDGMFDFMEIWSENDPAYAASIFAAENIAVGPDGVDITWTCVKGESYTVLRSEALGTPFNAVPALSALVAAETGYMTEKDTSAAGQAGPFYYRIRKD